MFTAKELESFIFLDIETAPATAHFEDLSPVMQRHWERKAERMHWSGGSRPSAAAAYIERAAVFAEYARVVCVSCGYLRFVGERPVPTLKTLLYTDERQLLTEVQALFNQIFAPPHAERRFCGHNLREFDLPFLGRRFLVHGLVPLPAPLQLFGKKPWDILHVDTMDFWRFGDTKSFTSLEILTELFGIDSPKLNMSGADVGHAFWVEQRYDDIRHYCEADVLATMQITLHVSGLPRLAEPAF